MKHENSKILKTEKIENRPFVMKIYHQLIFLWKCLSIESIKAKF